MEAISKENEVSFRVSFTETQNFQEKDMKLTFFGTSNPLFILEKSLIPDINKIIQGKSSFYTIANIREVASHSDKVKIAKYPTVFVVLYKEINSKNPKTESKGILIGISKEKEQFVLAIWPYSYYVEIKGDNQVAINKLKDILKNPALVSEFLLLTVQ
jgi:hypothetical protein